MADMFCSKSYKSHIISAMAAMSSETLHICVVCVCVLDRILHHLSRGRSVTGIKRLYCYHVYVVRLLTHRASLQDNSDTLAISIPAHLDAVNLFAACTCLKRTSMCFARVASCSSSCLRVACRCLCCSKIAIKLLFPLLTCPHAGVTMSMTRLQAILRLPKGSCAVQSIASSCK